MLIVVAIYDTEENGRSNYTKQTLESINDTVNFGEHSVILVDNRSTDKKTINLLSEYEKKVSHIVIRNSENIGTANAINKGIYYRTTDENVCKCDNDITFQTNGWADEMSDTLSENVSLGILGLKRVDVWQNISHENPDYRTYMIGKLEICDDIIGTCTGFSDRLLSKLGYMNQCSPYYGADDVLFSARSLAAGFKNAFLPHIKITHLDEGGTEYTEWKKREAGKYLLEVASMCAMYRTGKLPVYYNGGF